MWGELNNLTGEMGEGGNHCKWTHWKERRGQAKKSLGSHKPCIDTFWLLLEWRGTCSPLATGSYTPVYNIFGNPCVYK